MTARRLPCAAFVSILLAAAAPLGAGSAPATRVTQTLPIPPTTPLTLRATVGAITVAGWNRPQVSVEVDTGARSAEGLSRIAVTIDHDKGGARVTALQADGGRDAALIGSITVRAPYDQPFAAIDLFEGRITLKDLRGGVRAHVEHGSIDAESLAGRIRLESRIGDVRLTRAELSADGMIRLRAFNGDVTLGLRSPPPHARILALSMSGRIHSALPLSLRTTSGPRFGELTLGRGSPVVSIDVVRGDIHITTGRS